MLKRNGRVTLVGDRETFVLPPLDDAEIVLTEESLGSMSARIVTPDEAITILFRALCR